MRRREFIKLISGLTVAGPPVARAQQSSIPIIGYLNSGTPAALTRLSAAFLRGLKETGYVEGRNVAIEYRWAENRYDRLPEFAADLVARRVSLIVANTASMQAAKAATATTPVVFVSADDPVVMGLVASFNRSGGNATGVYCLISALEAKRAELLREVVPRGIAFLVDPNFPSAEIQLREVRDAMKSLGSGLLILRVGTASELDAAFAAAARARATALAIAASGFYFFRREQLVALAARYALPAVYPWREAVEAGGLMSDGASLSDAYRQGGI
jgi:putative ABC transport system substrate-binding protein